MNTSIIIAIIITAVLILAGGYFLSLTPNQTPPLTASPTATGQTPTASPSAGATFSPSPTLTATPSPTAAATKTPTPGPTRTPTTITTPVPAPIPTPTPTPSPTPAPTPTDSQTHSVAISGFAFSPSSLTIKAGDTVRWTNQDAVAHQIASDTPGEFQSGLIGAGQNYSFTFTKTGAFAYHCPIHLLIPHGTIIVAP